MPDSLKTVLKEYVKEQTSLTIKPRFAQLSSLDAVDEDDEEDASSSSKDAKAAAAQKKDEAARKKEDARLKELQKSVQGDFKAALKESGLAIVGDPVTKKIAGEVKKAIEKKQYDAAAAAMETLKAALD